MGCRKDSLENPEALQIGLDDTLAALNIFFKTFGAHMIHVWYAYLHWFNSHIRLNMPYMDVVDTAVEDLVFVFESRI